MIRFFSIYKLYWVRIRQKVCPSSLAAYNDRRRRWKAYASFILIRLHRLNCLIYFNRFTGYRKWGFLGFFLVQQCNSSWKSDLSYGNPQILRSFFFQWDFQLRFRLHLRAFLLDDLSNCSSWSGCNDFDSGFKKLVSSIYNRT